MLYPNGQRVFAYAGTHVAGSLVGCGSMLYGGLRGARLNRTVSGTYSNVIGAVPSGYGGSAYIMALKAGGLAGFSGLSVSPTASGVLGIPSSGSAAITFTVSDADGNLISSGSGSAAMSFTVANALLVASLGGSGNAGMSVSTNAPLLGAIASLTSSGLFTISGTLQPYAIGAMAGSTVDTTILTVDLIAAGVLAAALTSPIAADIKRVNAIQVDGNGQPGTEWGPV